jgi:hypothetical protein
MIEYRVRQQVGKGYHECTCTSSNTGVVSPAARARMSKDWKHQSDLCLSRRSPH